MEAEVCSGLPPGARSRAEFRLPCIQNKDQVINFNESFFFFISIEIDMGYVILIYFLALFG